MTTFTMFFIEFMASRFQVFGEQSSHQETSDQALELFRKSRTKEDSEDSESQESEQRFLPWGLLPLKVFFFPAKAWGLDFLLMV